MRKTTKLEAIVACKCPRCRKGNIFAGKIYSISGQKTKENCSHCNLRFEREPGFFYSAMYVGYALNVAQIVTIAIATYVLGGVPLVYESFWMYIGSILLGVLFFAPFNYRYSRVLLLHWLTPGLHYVPELSKPKEQ
ncbi:MAG: DUF983 domain-containing protein [Sphingobacteriaceae bacterium]|nr:DUF983 domain-containing protein [Sphingobacteriaceae bacterium]